MPPSTGTWTSDWPCCWPAWWARRWPWWWGCPALRLRGLFLAVTTLAFAMATSAYLLNVEHFSWVPDPNTVIARPHLFGGISLTSQRTYYYVCLVVLALAVVAVRGIRHSRTGRVLLALRENERGAQAFGVNVLRAKLTAFAISGFLAAVGGCLLVHLLGGYSPDTYAPDQSFVVFIAAVVGGLGSLLGAALGALYLKGAQWLLPGATLAAPGLGHRRAAGADDHPRWRRRPGLPGPRRGPALGGRAAGDHRAQPGGRPPPARGGQRGRRRGRVLAVQVADDIVAVPLELGADGADPDPLHSTGAPS